MVMNDFLYYKPKTLSEAIELRVRYGDSCFVLNGGTDVVIRLRERMIAPQALIDIKGIAELGGLYGDERGLWIGALATMQELTEHPTVIQNYNFLADAAGRVGSGQIRSRATCVGNIVNASPLCDTGTPLYAADAVIVTEGAGGRREIPIAEFISFVRRTILRSDELVTGIRVPKLKNAEGRFTKLSRRNELDLSTVCATILRVDDQYRLAFGAVAPTPVRLYKTEAYLSEYALTEERIAVAAALARSEVKPISDLRGSREYRLDMVQAITKSTLLALLCGGQCS